MPYSFIADPEKKLIRTKYRGQVGMSDLRSAIQSAMLVMRDSDATYRILTDFSSVSSWQVTTRELRELGGGLVPKAPLIRIERSALVAPQDSIYGDLRAWVAMTDPLPFERVVTGQLDG